MAKYGFVIDQRKCIGCHACTVACKMEHDIPVGVFRTWVKYIEKGTFPNTRRSFSIMRCQHCEDAPCVEICPTVALFKRADGIVDFDSARCIGCKSCMQACPYDALYIDPISHTAAKCNYCAHRVDQGLLPACVIVCPEKAIIAGDLDDPTSEIARLVAREQVQVRRPDQGTRPQVFYLGADEASMTPGLALQSPAYLWAELGPAGADLEPKGALDLKALGRSNGEVDGRPRTVYDVYHPKPWGWRVGTYLWTKAIAAGALGVGGLGLGTGLLGVSAGLLFTVIAPLLAVLFLAITAGLLIWDLKRPDRFYYILTKGNRHSWLVLGTYILILFGVIAGLSFLGGLVGLTGVTTALAWPGLVLALAAAGYSAFLFGQAEGRDFWQSPLLLWHLLAAAVVAGSAVLLLAGSVTLFVGGGVAFSADYATIGFLTKLLLGGLVASIGLTLVDLFSPHANKDVAAAAAYLTRGPLARRFWLGLLGGGALPLVLAIGGLGLASPVAAMLAAVLALAGLWLYEDSWIRAGQSVPIS